MDHIDPCLKRRCLIIDRLFKSKLFFVYTTSNARKNQVPDQNTSKPPYMSDPGSRLLKNNIPGRLIKALEGGVLFKSRLNKIAARWPARAVAQFYFIDN